MEERYYLICFYVPQTHLDVVKEALFDQGAGDYGNYDKACWQTLGIGQFRPLEGSNPHLGKINQIETIEEYKVEMICPGNKIQQCISALKLAHPYEVPAYQIIECFS